MLILLLNAIIINLLMFLCAELAVLEHLALPATHTTFP